MPGRPPVALRSLLLLALLTTAACAGDDGAADAPPPPVASGPVDVPVPTVGTQEVVQTCAALLASLPAEIGDGLRRREVTGDPGRTAAWGEPPVTLECGVPAPARDEPPLEVGPNDDGPLVGFTVRDVGAANRFTTRDTAVRVAVTVPDRYDSQTLISLTPPLRALATPGPSPSG